MIGPVSARQLRAARAWIGWSMEEAAGKAGLDRGTVKALETPRGPYQCLPSSLAALRLAYELERLVFTSFDGIAKRP
jgi:hypothetical protein